jgi:hypothetical protein
VVGGAPWPNVAEIEAVLPHDKWTLVGGLMAQLHGIHADIDTLRPTNDVDIVLHVETTRGIASETAEPLNRSAMSWRRRSMSGTTPPTGSSGPRATGLRRTAANAAGPRPRQRPDRAADPQRLTPGTSIAAGVTQAQLRLVGDFVVQMSDGPRGARGHRSIPPGIVDEVLAGHCAELASEVARCSMSCSQV